MQQLFNDISEASVTEIESHVIDEDELIIPYIRLDDMKEIRVKRNKSMLIKSIVELLHNNEIVSVD